MRPCRKTAKVENASGQRATREEELERECRAYRQDTPGYLDLNFPVLTQSIESGVPAGLLPVLQVDVAKLELRNVGQGRI